jgi:acetyltransferase-like isoleucine patch superfamily enzyme
MDWRRAARRASANPGMAFDTAVALARGQYYRVKFRLLRRRVVIGRFFRVSGPLDIRGPGTVIFGDFCSVISSRLAPTTPYTYSRDAVIRFGNRVLLTSTRFGCAESIDVGDGAGLSDARLMDTDFHSIEATGVPRYNTGGRSKPIVIGPNAWVGAGAMILKGVTIGESAVVGAGSVVASRVPARAVVLGNPARVIWRVKDMAPASAAGAPSTENRELATVP